MEKIQKDELIEEMKIENVDERNLEKISGGSGISEEVCVKLCKGSFNFDKCLESCKKITKLK